MTTHEIELEERIESRLKALDIIVRLGYALLAGAFALGVWVATIQIAINNHDRQLAESAALRQSELASIRALELKDSSDTQLLRSIVEKLERIERKLSP